MTELELFDKLNPKRDLPQATCDVISQVYKVMQKENADLQHRLDVAQGFLDRDMEYNRLLDVINNQDVTIADLEKRNAQQCKTVERCVDTVHEVYEQYDKASEQLEQARKIISLCRFTLKDNGYDFTRAYKQAEQFIGEEK